VNLRSAEIKSVAGTAFFRGGWGAAPCSQTKTRSRARCAASSQLCDEYKQSVMKNRTHFAHTASTCGPIAGAYPSSSMVQSCQEAYTDDERLVGAEGEGHNIKPAMKGLAAFAAAASPSYRSVDALPHLPRLAFH
jgi:hypothetical protein